MVFFTPGSLILYRASASLLPQWPAVVCTDDVAPANFVQNRADGYVSLVLLMGEEQQFRWAHTTEMHDFDPFVPFTDEETVENTPGLGDAYEMANFALEAGFGLDHWREQVRKPITISSSGSEDGDADSDPEMRLALRASREHYFGKAPKKRSAILPTPSLSPPKRIRRPSTRFDAFKPAAKTPSSSHPTLSDPWQRHEDPCARSTSTDKNSGIRATHQKTTQWTPFVQRSFMDRLRHGPSSSKPVDDEIEGELCESKDFVQVLVGPKSEVSTLHKQAVWDRDYFRETRLSNLNYFDQNDDGIWQLKHPRLHEIEPADFAFAAEFLESGDFGHKYPEGDEEVHEAFAESISAWDTAEKLGMTDLLDHICDKMERIAPWDMWDVLAFACQVFTSPPPDLTAQTRMKDILATDIAEHYWIYIEDDHLSTTFVQRLRDLPELEHVIYVKRAKALKIRLGLEEEEDVMDMD
ncbi:hypothetical protein EJ02DRAFT_449307 [Clathrospora elynae]|uniref:PWWP domain-containing protein n=1 Tax=Clathrospora elynae TaxID=706981 RepID=A0A6A5T7M1_9PLEO|nr:hypothetical protein EJ02DRAFT_449307 [Clathrospora elynae]